MNGQVGGLGSSLVRNFLLETQFLHSNGVNFQQVVIIEIKK